MSNMLELESCLVLGFISSKKGGKIRLPTCVHCHVANSTTVISGPRLIRAWKRRYWIEYCFRTLKHLLAAGACQVQSEDAYYGHLVLRLMGCLVLFYTSRVVCKGPHSIAFRGKVLNPSRLS